MVTSKYSLTQIKIDHGNEIQFIICRITYHNHQTTIMSALVTQIRIDHGNEISIYNMPYNLP